MYKKAEQYLNISMMKWNKTVKSLETLSLIYLIFKWTLAQSAGPVEYTDSISAEE